MNELVDPYLSDPFPIHPYVSEYRKIYEVICGELRRLHTDWQEHVEEKKAGGLMERARQLLGHSSYDYDDDGQISLSLSVSGSVNQLVKDWDLLQMLRILYIHNRNPWVNQAIDEAANKIYWDVCFCSKYLGRPLKILHLLRECQSDTNNLVKLEARQYPAFYDFAVTDNDDVDLDFTTRDYSDFIPLILRNLRSLEDAGDAVLKEQLYFLSNELQSIHSYIMEVDKSVGLDSIYPERGDFVNYIYLVVRRTALRSCHFWSSRGDPKAAKDFAHHLKILHGDIDPSTNAEFLELNLGLLKYCNNNGLAAHFCDYILGDLGNQDLRKDLIYLLERYIRLHEDEDVHGVFAEIRAVLAEAASYSRRAALPSCSDLLAKLCLARTELFLLEELNTQKKQKKDSLQVDGIVTSLRGFAEELSILCRQANSEYVKRNLTLAEELGNEIDSFDKSFHTKRITYPLVSPTLQHCLLKIAFSKAVPFLTDLLKSTHSSIAKEKDQIQSLVQELGFFKRILRYKLAKYSSDEEAVIIQAEALVRGVTLLSYFFLPDNNNVQKIISSLPNLLDRAKAVKAKLKGKSQPFPTISFPTTDQLGFIDTLGRHISELFKHDPKSIEPVTDIEEVLLHLQSLKSFLAKVKDSDADLGELKDLRNHIIELAYKLEYIVDSIELGVHLHQSLWLYDLLEDIRLVNQQVSKIHPTSFSGKVKDSTLLIPSQMASRQHPTLEANEMLMDLVDEEKEIIERLTRGSKQRDVVPIVGMAGSGKTTLARKLYNNRNVMSYFYRRAWCTVSQTYSKRELLLEILSHMPVPPDKMSQMTDHDLLSKFRRCLLGNRYLIVMDDVWDTAAWNDLKYCFPDDNNGSRILITTRLRDVVSEIKPDSNPHFIRPFSNVESWMLLEKKIFKGSACPADLLEAGMEIAHRCQGLPLALVAIAGLLLRIEESKDSWQKLSRSLSSEIISDPENRCKEILELSYKHLPEYLKQCFLYLGVFLEDKNIPVSKLIRFWMAEGFIQESGSKSLEEVGEDYLLELINRSLVSVYKERSNGKPRTCRLHDLLRDLCHLKAKEENFLQLVSGDDEPYAFFPDTDYDIEFDTMDQFPPTIFESYRLSFYLKRGHFIDSRPFGLGVRSLTFFSSIDSEPKCPYDIFFICHNFKLLRLLDLEYIMASGFPDEIGLLTRLRYIAVSGYMQSIPPSISNLWRLETLVVNGLRGKVFLPETIWSMERLRHLRVNKYVGFSTRGLDEQGGNSFLLQNLVSLSTPCLSFGKDKLSNFIRFPYLQKLRCIFSQSWNSSEDCNGFPVLDFLTYLESLKVIYRGRAINSGVLVLPSNLKKLTLSNFCLQGHHLSTIGKLPYLQILKLLAGAFEGGEWIMEEEEFKELLFLELDAMNIAKWNSCRDHLPSLERLVLWNCTDLEVIPFDFAYIATLKTIEVQWCSQSVVESAEAIHEETNEIEVVITHF